MTNSIDTVGIIGSGHIGSIVAELAVAAGFDVVVSNSRGPETLTELVDKLGPKARAATSTEAAAAGDIVVVTVPLKAYRQVPVEPLAGKVVLDTNNYYPERDGQIAALDDHTATTSGLLQDHLATSRVVKVFNNIFYVAFAALPRPTGDPERTVLPIFGDDQAAKSVAGDFVDALGYDVLDSGELTESWRSENGQPGYVQPYSVGGDVNTPAPVDAATMTDLLQRATR